MVPWVVFSSTDSNPIFCARVNQQITTMTEILPTYSKYTSPISIRKIWWYTCTISSREVKKTRTQKRKQIGGSRSNSSGIELPHFQRLRILVLSLVAFRPAVALKLSPELTASQNTKYWTCCFLAFLRLPSKEGKCRHCCHWQQPLAKAIVPGFHCWG